ncbi:MAG: ABC transporter substrate-binding protein, partial [Pseudanabaenales cyanobacterium]|nr:ABC transporter substrate-binding protein [Pseudanabaenales cyanobacterium]
PSSGLQTWFWLILLSLSLMLASCQAQIKDDRDIIHLTLWQGVSPPSNRQVFQSLVERFNQTHANIQVESLYVGQPDQQIPKILTAVVGNAAPDLLWYVPALTGQLVELEAIQPLEDWLNQSPLKDQIDPALFATMTMEGHIWSIPFATNNAAIFYRPSLFEAAGMTHVPETWEELRQAAKQLTQDTDGDGRIDQQGIVLSLGKGEWTVFVWLPFVFSAGGHLYHENQTDLVNPGAIAALQLGAKLVQDGSAILSSPERGYEIDNFLAGKAAMQVTGPWTLPQMERAGVDFDAFPFPVLETPAAVVGGENIFLCQTTPERTEAALEFLEYILSQEFQLDWALGTGYLPVNLKVRNSKVYQEFVAQHPPLDIFLKQMEWARARPLIPGYTHLSENFGRAIEASLLGQSPEVALKEAQARLELILGK